LVLYTDGLVERRDEPIDAGLGRLRSVVADGPNEAEALCSYLLESAPGAGARAEDPEDDLTALVVGLTGESSATRAVQSPRTHDAPGVHDSAPGANDPASGAENRIHATLARDAHAPARARKLIARSFGQWLDPEQLDRARLAVSEVITNAVLHGEGAITLLADIDDSRLLVEVVDEGSGFEYTVRERAFGDVGGRGLSIVDQVTSRWGTREGAAHVWFEIERRKPPEGRAAVPAL
jgi:anti-sigma regulatory factor (Ser/Thr protein kinase)